MNGPEIIHPDKDVPGNINQMQIVGMVHQLFKLSGELQDEVDHTDLKATFPLSVVKKAHRNQHDGSFENVSMPAGSSHVDALAEWLGAQVL
jgi:hypothetical protein